MYQEMFAIPATGKKIEIRAFNTTDGSPNSSITQATPGIVAEYKRTGGNWVTFALGAGTIGVALNNATNGDIVNLGFGLYEVSVPNNALASGTVDGVTIRLRGVTDVYFPPVYVQLTNINYRASSIPTTVTALTNNIITSSAFSANAINSTVVANDTITSAKIQNGALTAAKFAAGAFDAVWTVTTRTLTSFGTLANDVWAVSTRTLTSFGSLVSDIWTSGSRTLTSFGTLVNDIWSAGSRTLTSFGTVANDVWAALVSGLTVPGSIGAKVVADFNTIKAEQWTASERSQIRERLGIDGLAATPAASPSLATAAALSVVDQRLDTEIPQIIGLVSDIPSIKAKTDDITFTTPNQVDVRVISVATTPATDIANRTLEAEWNMFKTMTRTGVNGNSGISVVLPISGPQSTVIQTQPNAEPIVDFGV